MDDDTVRKSVCFASSLIKWAGAKGQYIKAWTDASGGPITAFCSLFAQKYNILLCVFRDLTRLKNMQKTLKNACISTLCMVLYLSVLMGKGVSMPKNPLHADMRWCRRWPFFETGNFCGVCPILKPGETGLSVTTGCVSLAPWLSTAAIASAFLHPGNIIFRFLKPETRKHPEALKVFAMPANF